MVLARLAEVQGEIQKLEAQQTIVREEIEVHRDQRLDEERITHAFVDFDPLWEALTPTEQARVIHLMVEQVDYDGGQGKVTITFHPTGIKTLLDGKRVDNKKESGGK
jgi:site-specific DNA recombinase